MRINKRIRKLRIKNNIKLEVLSKGIVSASHLSNIEAGRDLPSEDILNHLARKFEVPSRYLVQYDSSDNILISLLEQFESELLTNFEEASYYYFKIKKNYPYINSVYHEAKFFILESCYLLIQ